MIVPNINAPVPGATYEEWYHYNDTMYQVMMNPSSADDYKQAFSNLLKVNEPMFYHKAAKMKVGMYDAAEFEDALQIQRLRFAEIITECLAAGEVRFPEKARIFGYGCEKEMYEEYRPGGVVMSYPTKKRKVNKETYDVVVSTVLEEDQGKRRSKDSDMYPNVYQEELSEALDNVLDLLTEEERLIFLFHANGLTNQQIANAVGLKAEGAIRHRLSMIREKLNDTATEYGLDSYLYDMYH